MKTEKKSKERRFGGKEISVKHSKAISKVLKNKKF